MFLEEEYLLTGMIQTNPNGFLLSYNLVTMF